MKKLLMVLLLVAFATSLFAGVDMRLRQVSYTLGAAVGNTETLVVAIDCRGSSAYQIYKFFGAFDVGSVLMPILTSQTVSTSSTLFTNPNYSVQENVSGGIAKYKYISNFPGTPSEVTLSTAWQEVLQVTVQWTRMYPPESTNFRWNDDDGQFLFSAEWWFVGPNFGLPITGQRVSMSSQGFEDFSLPVDLASFEANFDYDLGGTEITWRCGSQQGVDEFRVLRSEDCVNWTEVGRLQGEGTTTQTLDYSILDASAQPGINYVYNLLEVVGNNAPNGIAVAELGNSTAPTKFDLGDNYPNPFNPGTLIPIEIVEGGHTTLKIYNLLGQEIKTLLDKELPLGYSKEQPIEWDGFDNNGVSVPSGVYLYKLQSGTDVQIKRMTKVK